MNKTDPHLWLAIALGVLFPLVGVLLATGNDTVGFIFGTILFLLLLAVMISGMDGRRKRGRTQH